MVFGGSSPGSLEQIIAWQRESGIALSNPFVSVRDLREHHKELFGDKTSKKIRQRPSPLIDSRSGRIGSSHFSVAFTTVEKAGL